MISHPPPLTRSPWLAAIIKSLSYVAHKFNPHLQPFILKVFLYIPMFNFSMGYLVLHPKIIPKSTQKIAVIILQFKPLTTHLPKFNTKRHRGDVVPPHPPAPWLLPVPRPVPRSRSSRAPSGARGRRRPGRQGRPGRPGRGRALLLGQRNRDPTLDGVLMGTGNHGFLHVFTTKYEGVTWKLAGMSHTKVGCHG